MEPYVMTEKEEHLKELAAKYANISVGLQDIPEHTEWTGDMIKQEKC